MVVKPINAVVSAKGMSRYETYIHVKDRWYRSSVRDVARGIRLTDRWRLSPVSPSLSNDIYNDVLYRRKGW